MELKKKDKVILKLYVECQGPGFETYTNIILTGEKVIHEMNSG